MTSQPGVFVLQNDETLLPLQPAQFTDELDFQRLLTRFPALLVGDQISPDDPCRFILVKAEQPVGHQDDAMRWSLDHLFLDQHGVPTLVEVKRKSDTRLRREVVGQMLDYASNCQAFWSVEGIRSSFEAHHEDGGAVALQELLGDTHGGTEEFWDAVKTNLQAGKIRMLFVADYIPSELRRIVEFLNKQMDPAEVLAVELRQFRAEGLRTLVPMVYGQSQEASRKRPSSAGERWTAERFLDAFRERLSPTDAAIGGTILEWLKNCGMPLLYGTGRDNGSVYPLLKPGGVTINPAYLTTDGKIWLQFQSLKGKPVFDDLDRRAELRSRFASVANSDLANGPLDGYAKIAFATIAADPEGVSKILSAWQWLIDQVKATK